tara:strand:+ start:270 stop:881 length:612 start_codon:yes stop_codon:yes gene_type:complete
MALMGSDQAKMGQNDQARAVLEWLSSEGAQNLLRQVSADRAQTADGPDIQRGQEEVQRRRDTAVHDWLNTPEAQRFLMGRGDADIAMRQQGQRGSGSGAGPQPQPPGSMGFTPQQPFQGGPSPMQMQNPRTQMMEQLMAAGPANPDFDRGPYTPGAFQQQPRGQGDWNQAMTARGPAPMAGGPPGSGRRPQPPLNRSMMQHGY